jgi:primosomal protein N' (replication factor Y)
MTALIATVAVAAPLEKPLSYLVPEGLRGQARVGVRVQVPLGRRRTVGFLLELSEGDGEGLKEVAAVLDEAPLFPPEMVPFFRRAADYYCHPLGETIRTALPAGLSGRGEEPSILHERLFAPAGRIDLPSGRLQREILATVRVSGRVALSELRRRFSAPHASLRRLVEQGFLAEETAEVRRDPFLDAAPPPDRPVEPNPAQAAALDAVTAALDGGAFAPFLLHGVTGSGKTEVYLRAIAAALERGRTALVLVPEIALTPQLVGRFRARFAGRDSELAVLHSGLSDGERFDAWRAIVRGTARIVIGARSAVFAPLSSPGIIIVDEEHEASYKQAEGLRYHARDLALLRGQMASCVVLLGSATPSLATYHRAQGGPLGYLSLAERVAGRPLPEVTLVDLRQARPDGEGSLSPPLAAALAEALERGEQALLLLNRRGFAPYLLCADCGATFRCPNCAITLTFHRGRRQLRCHYCDHAEPPPDLCPGCGGGDIAPQGAGTERLEEELALLFPQARIARMDRDTTARKGAHQRLVERMAAGEVDILVGTQMVAKGHDFPAVTLVGVVGAYASLNLPDFRSAERTFVLLAQVAGRAGRGERPGRVLIQTYAPEHYALTCAAGHDYAGFYAQEAVARRELGYPPFGHLVNLVLSGNDAPRVQQAAERLAAGLEERAAGAEVLGPAPCPLARLRGKSRFQILLKAPPRPSLRRLLARLPELRKRLPAGVALAIDVDPVDML